MDRLAIFVQDIAERKLADWDKEITVELLRAINSNNELHSLSKEVMDSLLEWSGCECVGMRIQAGLDYPYFETRGFSKEFVLAENKLCLLDEEGDIIQKNIGNPALDCMCGTVIMGKTNPELPHFSQNGSFWTNCTTELLANTSEEERMGRTRNRCNGEGYESVALIPLKVGNQSFGLLQFNDKRKGRFTPKLIKMLERQAEYLSIAISHRLSNNALKESEERYRTLQRNLPVGIYRSTPKGKIISANSFIVKLLGYKSEEELLNISAIDLYENHNDRKKMLELLMTDGSVSDFESQTKCKDGSIIWISDNAQAIKDDSGNIIHFDGTIRDITSQKLAQDRLRESEEKYRMIYETAASLIASVDSAGIIIDCNARIKDFLGYEKTDIIGQPITKIVHSNSIKKVNNTLKKIITKGGSQNNEFKFIKKDGTEISAAVNSSALTDIDGNFEKAIFLIEDITEKRKMEENLIKHEKLESLGILAGGIAHDFNNILTAVMANISLAVLDNNSNHLVHASLAEAQKAISRAHDLTNQLLTFSRGGAPVKSLIPIAKIIKEASSFALSGSKVRCRFSIPDDLFNVRADSGQMSQVFHNLILNAGQAMPDGGDIIISAENYIIKRKDPIPLKAGNFVKIIIKDHGCGIAEKYLNKIFDPFFTTKQKGSGLGLSSTYSIIKKHGGHIEVESRFGHGTAFTIYLSASKKRMGLTNLKEEGLLPGSGQILLMDDDEAIQKATGKVLEKVGYEVDYASNGRETIKKYSGALKKGHPYDAVILDLTIPGGIGGVEVANRLREMDPHVRAIVTSGYSNNPILSNYTKYGFMGYIPKPYEIKKMITTVRKVIDNEVC